MARPTKMTHKALKEMGKALHGKYYDGNIYAHENRVHYLSIAPYGWGRSSWRAEVEKMNAEILPLIDDLAEIMPDSANCEQLAYATGIYGNIGQLHKIDYYKNGNIVCTVTTYC